MKRVGIDTSVMVAGLVEQHPHHAGAAGFLRQVMRGECVGVLTGHALAESYAVLSALPLRPRLRVGEVQQLLKVVVSWEVELVDLQAADYLAAVDLTVKHGLASGAIYDALHVVGFLKAGCTEVATFNVKHFAALVGEMGLRSLS